MKTNNYTPPHDHEAEVGMLACVLIAPKAQAALLVSKLSDDLWDDPRHKLIYQTLVQLKKEGKALDSVSLYQKLKDFRNSADIKDYTLTIADAAPSYANWPTYHDTLTDRAWRRRVLEKLRALAIDVCDTGQNIKDIAVRLREVI